MGVIVTQGSINETMGEIASAIIEFQEELGKKVLAVLEMKAEFVGVPYRYRPNFLNDLIAEIRETLKDYILAGEEKVEFTKDELEDAITETKSDIWSAINKAEESFMQAMMEAVLGDVHFEVDVDSKHFLAFKEKIGNILESGLVAEEESDEDQEEEETR